VCREGVYPVMTFVVVPSSSAKGLHFHRRPSGRDLTSASGPCIGGRHPLIRSRSCAHWCGPTSAPIELWTRTESALMSHIEYGAVCKFRARKIYKRATIGAQRSITQGEENSRKSRSDDIAHRSRTGRPRTTDDGWLAENAPGQWPKGSSPDSWQN